MQHADLLTVIHHDDTTTDFCDVRYTLTADGLRILDAVDHETVLSAHDVLTTHVHTSHQRPETAR
jgi:hypothetical protein